MFSSIWWFQVSSVVSSDVWLRARGRHGQRCAHPGSSALRCGASTGRGGRPPARCAWPAGDATCARSARATIATRYHASTRPSRYHARYSRCSRCSRCSWCTKPGIAITTTSRNARCTHASTFFAARNAWSATNSRFARGNPTSWHAWLATRTPTNSRLVAGPRAFAAPGLVAPTWARQAHGEAKGSPKTEGCLASLCGEHLLWHNWGGGQTHWMRSGLETDFFHQKQLASTMCWHSSWMCSDWWCYKKYQQKQHTYSTNLKDRFAVEVVSPRIAGCFRRHNMIALTVGVQPLVTTS